MSATVPQAETLPALEPGAVAIGVWMGGASRERQVSLASGRAVAEAAACQERPYSLLLNLPPLGVLFFKAGPRKEGP